MYCNATIKRVHATTVAGEK